MRDVVFYLGLGTLFTHELDAVSNHEWQVLPWIRELPDEIGMVIFVLLHVPLFAAVIALVASLRPGVRRLSRIAVALFLVVHAVLHVLFSDHGSYEFSSTASGALIFGGAGLGVLYLLLSRSGTRLSAAG